MTQFVCGFYFTLRTEPTEQEEEAIEICEVQDLSKGLIPNLTWLIPLALDTNFEFGEGQEGFRSGG